MTGKWIWFYLVMLCSRSDLALGDCNLTQLSQGRTPNAWAATDACIDSQTLNK